MKTVPLQELTLDPRLQMRQAMNNDVVEDYAEHLDKLPAAKVILDEDGHLFVTDGWHTYFAYEKAGKAEMPCEVREGTFRDAMLEAAGANHTHGLRRTNADKRRSVKMLLEDEEWVKASDRWIAEKCHVGHPLVATVRAEMKPTGISSSSNNQGEDKGETEPDEKRMGRDQKRRPASKPESSTPSSEQSEQSEATDPAANGVDLSWLCDRCRRMKGPACAKCREKAFQRSFAEPEKTAQPKPEQPPKPEKPPYNDKLVTDRFADLIEKLDERRETYGEHEDYHSCRDLIHEARQVFTRWQTTTKGMTTAETQQALFDNFWAAYPKKTQKEDALKAWKKLSPDAALVARMLESIKAWEQTEGWQKSGGQFIPYPATWLNGKRWEDELPKAPKTAKELAEEGVRKAREKKAAKSNTH